MSDISMEEPVLETGPRKFHSLQELSVLYGERQETVPAEEKETEAQPPAVAQHADRRFTNTYLVAGPMMYLIGVDEIRFQRHVPDLSEQYATYDACASARIIRALCRIRTALMKRPRRIHLAFRYGMEDLSTLTELIPVDAVRQLDEEGIHLEGNLPDVDRYMRKINKLVADHINDVQGIFPEWVKWWYLRPLFLMPNGMKTEGIRREEARYNKDRNKFPYHCYMNWSWHETGNLLSSDSRFLRALYEAHGDTFDQMSLVKDVGNDLREDLYRFLAPARRIMIMVDCENSDPVKLAAAIKCLDAVQRQKICKIILFDSAYTTAAWQTLTHVGAITEDMLEHITVPRLYEHKSQVDMTLAVRTCQEVYRDDVDSVILVSSDSDYWALIQALTDVGVRFLVMLEKEKTGSAITEALDKIFCRYCYLDDFCTGPVYTIKTEALHKQMQEHLDGIIPTIDMKKIMEKVMYDSWIRMTEKEQKMFYDRYVRSMHLTLDKDGTVKVLLGPV